VLAQTTTFQVQRRLLKKIKKTKEVEEDKSKMLGQGCHPSAKMTMLKTDSSKKATTIKLRKPDLHDVETPTLAVSRGSVNFGNKRTKDEEGKGRTAYSMDWGEVFDRLRRKELQTLGNRLKSTVFKQVIGRCKKSLGGGKEVIIDASTINAIFSSVVALSESEPYGVRGGSLVVLFAPAPNSKDTPVKIGHFPMDPSTVATFELHLTIQASMAVTTRVRQTLTNIVRKIGGKPTQVHIDPKFKLIKKKLYRSSTSN